MNNAFNFFHGMKIASRHDILLISNFAKIILEISQLDKMEGLRGANVYRGIVTGGNVTGMSLWEM